MIYSVNLLPDSCHNLRRRAVRRTAWTIVLAWAGLLTTGSWIGLQAVNHTLTRLERQLGGIQVKQTELDRQLVFACVERNSLVERARALAALRQDPDTDGLPERLYRLSRLAPEGIVLTELRSQPAELVERSAPPPSAPGAGAAPAVQRSSRSLNVQITGFARDHNELTRLIDAIEHIASWERVDLERAAIEPFQGGTALSFRLDCRGREEAK